MVLKWLKRLVKDERGGGNMILMLALVLGIIAISPFFVDLASVQYARRMAQTGTDAAALAAAKSLAMILSGVTPRVSDGEWHRSPSAAREAAHRVAAGRYFLDIYAGRALGGLGRTAALASAQEYAEANRTVLQSGADIVHVSKSCTSISGYSICDVLVSCAVDREVALFMRDLYGRDFRTPAHASAEAYLVRYGFNDREHTRQMCDYMNEDGVCTSWRTEYQVWSFLVTNWKIRLVE